MLRFDCDYLEGAHPAIIKRLHETNLEQSGTYGFDSYSDSAKEKIKLECNAPDASVFFCIGGTQANTVVITQVLKPWQAALAANTGHIANHEAGAIEAAGHKVFTLPHANGKLAAETVRDFILSYRRDPSCDHIPDPRLVYISYPTEYGTLYSKKELELLRAVCDEFELTLFMDGARLGYGLASPSADLSLADIASLCDVFTIGGTKVGALFGEAVVFAHPELCAHFFTLMKQRGAVLAKGRMLGIQFDTLFSNKLYFEIATHAVTQALRLKEAFVENDLSVFIDSPTNQQFVVLENMMIERLSSQVIFEHWEPFDENHTVVRFATSWATRVEDVDALIALLGSPYKIDNSPLPQASTTQQA